MRHHFALVVVLLTTSSVIISQKIYRMTCRIAKMYNIEYVCHLYLYT